MSSKEQKSLPWSIRARNPTDGFKPKDEIDLTLSYLDRASQYSYQDAGAKMDLSIRYNSTGLHDVGQKNGYLITFSVVMSERQLIRNITVSKLTATSVSSA